MLHGWGLSKTDFEASGLAGNGTSTWHAHRLGPAVPAASGSLSTLRRHAPASEPLEEGSR
jgi:hypothetical protein